MTTPVLGGDIDLRSFLETDLHSEVLRSAHTETVSPFGDVRIYAYPPSGRLSWLFNLKYWIYKTEDEVLASRTKKTYP
jgi:hypothetical protein